MTATMECLACGHENKPGAAFCDACSTSLNLKLCAACEAVNALAADKCHDCGASLVEGVPPPLEAPAQKASEPDLPVLEPVEAGEHVLEEAPRRTAVPMLQHSRPPTRTGRFATLWFVSVALASGVGYYVASGQIPMLAAAPGLTAAAPEPQPRPEPVQAREGPIELAPKPAAKSVPSRLAKPPAAQTTLVRRDARAPITHTRATSTGTATAATASPAAAVEEPAVAGAAVSEAPLPEAAAAPSYARVTHTKPAGTLEKPVEPVLEKPINNQPAGCAPSVAALGLCPAR
jgi:hypothetical protein